MEAWVRIATVMVCATIFSACSVTNDLKYGKLYTMHESLHNASQNCLEDRDRRNLAVNWAVYGIQDLYDSKGYMDKDSDEYLQVKQLIRQLKLVTSRRNSDTKTLCDNIHQAASATQKFFAETVASAN